jgi:hypothetical protein
VSHTCRRSQDIHEQPVIARVLAKLLVDQMQVAFDQSDRVGTDAAYVLVLLQ